MSELDAVAEAIWRETLSIGDTPWEFGVHSNHDERGHFRRTAQAAIDVLRPTVSTVEQLDALPEGSVIRDADDVVWVCDCLDTQEWLRAGSALYYSPAEIDLPCLVLWRPDQQAVS